MKQELISKNALRQLGYSGFLGQKRVVVRRHKVPFLGNVSYFAEQKHCN
jgi:hypothetical protein